MHAFCGSQPAICDIIYSIVTHRVGVVKSAMSSRQEQTLKEDFNMGHVSALTCSRVVSVSQYGSSYEEFKNI